LHAAEYRPGRSYFGERNFIEYLPGDLPLVISAPHGGREDPEEIPQREAGVVQMDTNTQELARAIGEEVLARTGHRPHLILCRLHRRRLDCNREIVEAAAGNPVAEKAWNEYHAFIDTALAAATAQAGKAFFIDLHGQAHKDQRIELGYLHSRDALARTDAELDTPAIAAEGSLRRIAARSKLPYSALLRGPRSLGALLEARDFPCTPSPGRPTPNLPYFQGGYTVRRHVAADAPVAGLQIECNMNGVRDTAANRAKFATALVATLREYLAEHFDLRLPAL
jgi:N-formylglutamate amidohydrolase